MNVVVAGRKGILEPSETGNKGSILFLHGKRNDRNAPLLKHISSKFSQYNRLRCDFGFVKTKKASEGLREEIIEAKEMLSFLLRRSNLPASKAIIIGKSMGAMTASYVAGMNKVKGVVFLGYPVHERKSPSSWFPHEHLSKIKCPILMISGDKDVYGNLTMLRALKRKNKNIDLVMINNADHGFRPVDKSTSLKQNYEQVAEIIIAWINTISS